MREIIHEGEPFEDAVRPISEDNRADKGFVAAENNVNSVFREIGASVIGGISYAGEQPDIRLFIRPSQTITAQRFNNRPA